MRSPEIVRLQQQFLASLHDEPKAWLLDQIIAPPGFKDSREILEIYLHRAKARTVDPLKGVYKCLAWVIGDQALNNLIDKFYADCLGEPLNAQTMATEFGAFLGSLSQSELDRAAVNVNLHPNCEFDVSVAMVAAALLDWRCHWVSLIEHRSEERMEALHKKLHHRSSMWLRPRLNKTSRLCTSSVNLTQLRQLMLENSDSQTIPSCLDGPSTFLIHADQKHHPAVRQLTTDEDRLLNHCDGTHTIASLSHEARFYGKTKEETMQLIRQLIDEGVIRNLDDLLI